jgi:hypothetical protein
LPDDDSPGTHGPFFDQPVDDVRVPAREIFGNGFVAAVKNNQSGVGGFGKGDGKNNFAAIISFAGQAQVFDAKGRTASDKIVCYLVEQGKVWHRTSGEFFQMAG